MPSLGEVLGGKYAEREAAKVQESGIPAFQAPAQVWVGKQGLSEDYIKGARDVYCGLGRDFRVAGKSKDYLAGRRAQMKMLPKRSSGRVDWDCYQPGSGWYPTGKTGLEHWGY